MNGPSLAGRRVKEVAIERMNGAVDSQVKDFLAAEEPLEIRIEGHSVAVVMRTPGDDRELSAGFVVTEGLVRHVRDIVEITEQPHCKSAQSENGRSETAPERGPGKQLTSRVPNIAGIEQSRVIDSEANQSNGNLINVRLKRPESLELSRLTRHVFSSSSCGICSKASIDAVRQQFPAIEDDFQIDPRLLLRLPAALDAAQETFKRTGGLHACALFDLLGHLVVLREDVGRHNALDKTVGWALLNDRLPLRRHILLLSGRASFEMMQKALAAGIPVVTAISAPSSLAVEFARESGQTLVGFLRGDRLNIYAGAQRLR